MGCVGLTAIWGGITFAVIGGVWWLIAGHRPPMDLVWGYLALVGFAVYCTIDSYIDRWREESKETAKNVRAIMLRIEHIESLISLYKKD